MISARNIIISVTGERMEKVVVNKRLLDFLREAAVNGLKEALLLGFRKDETYFVTGFIPLNHAIKAIKSGANLVGVFHCHRGSSAPSAEDLRYMEMWRLPWIIYNYYEVCAYILKGKKLTKLSLYLQDKKPFNIGAL